MMAKNFNPAKLLRNQRKSISHTAFAKFCTNPTMCLIYRWQHFTEKFLFRRCPQLRAADQLTSPNWTDCLLPKRHRFEKEKCCQQKTPSTGRHFESKDWHTSSHAATNIIEDGQITSMQSVVYAIEKRWVSVLPVGIHYFITPGEH